MKRFIFLFLISIFCFSCINNSSNTNVSKVTEESNFPSDKLEFTTYCESTNYHLANIDTMPHINISVNITYPLATGVSNDDNLLIKDFISDCIGKEYANKPSVEDAAKSFIDDIIKEYKHNVCGSTPESKVINDGWMNHDYETYNTILYNANGILSYSNYTYTYSGGAHGLGTKVCFVYDVYENKTIDIYSIFKEEHIDDVLTLIKEDLIKNEVGVFDMNNVNVTENFFVDEKGIHWIYNPYEIASYAEGIIEVVLPYSKIQSYFIENTPIKSIYK